MVLETGFLCIFLSDPPPKVVFWMIRWELFRVMFGAGLIKMRGDSCWRDLTCLVFHYETQPLPNPLSWYFNQFPLIMHQLGALWNHFCELIVPWSLFAPRRWRRWGGLFLIAFQTLLILSGRTVSSDDPSVISPPGPVSGQISTKRRQGSRLKTRPQNTRTHQNSFLFPKPL